METIQILQIIWFILIGVLFIGYSVLDGFDLGIGTLLPYFARDKKDITALFTAIGPVWDGNEVWLLTGGGALFAAFPHVYATVFSGFYLALMLVLFALIFRAVALEFWSLDENRRTLWKWAFTVGSALPSLLFGVALGNVLIGIPLNDKMEFTGTFFTLLRPYPLAIGLLGLSAILLQGCAYGALKTEGELHDRIVSAGKKIAIAYAALLALSIIVAFIVMPERMANIPAWICTAIVFIAIAAARSRLGKNSGFAAFILSSISFIGLWGIAGSIQFPNLVRATDDAGLHLQIYNTSSSQLTLSVMLIIALIGMPIVLGYTIYSYRVFKGKVSQ
ncbi:MAG: cytochrome d ubiquinol oxidase subunit II [Spirochaetes bacterium]|nr:cytochrome d ubiquinol oxidase subunit II [Spirochaetota bacterium]